MLSIGSQARIFLHAGAIDMRKSFEGLSQIALEAFDAKLTSAAYFIFLNKRRDRMKVLYWDGDGLALWYKRLEKGTFIPSEKSPSQIDRRRFFMLLEGVSAHKFHKRYQLESRG